MFEKVRDKLNNVEEGKCSRCGRDADAGGHKQNSKGDQVGENGERYFCTNLKSWS